MQHFKISVVIPSYNRADLLPRTIKSVVAQTLAPCEVIIVDDESSDETHSVCHKLIDKYKNHLKIIYIRHKKNKGEAGARNTGINIASGNYFAFLDSDDEWLPDKLEKQVRYIQTTNADGVFCESYLVENEEYNKAENIAIDHDRIIAKKLLTHGCGYGAGTNLLISSRAVGRERFDENLRLFIDLDWLFRVSQRARIDIMHEGLSYYHKAPMRSGDYIKQHAISFVKKYKEILCRWSFYSRGQVYSCMNWYIAHAYMGNKNYLSAAKHFLLGIAQSPIRHPGHYVMAFSLLAKGIISGGEQV